LERTEAPKPARAASSLSAFAQQSPEQWLQGIADLRKQRRHEEADKELAEFRKRYPEYKIPPAMRERVERR
jgi:trimethylamine:corrinoid methyltransferase-like protein